MKIGFVSQSGIFNRRWARINADFSRKGTKARSFGQNDRMAERDWLSPAPFQGARIIELMTGDVIPG